MLIEMLVGSFVVCFVAIALYGHFLVIQALLASRSDREPAKPREIDRVPTAAVTRPRPLLRKVA